LNGFDSWIAEDNRFWSLMAKTQLLQELDGQKWTFSLDQISTCDYDLDLALLINVPCDTVIL
jgi:hypothetical protein